MNEHIFGFETQKAWDYENGYYLTSPTSRLAKAIAHWELYKKIQHIPGDIVECGTFKGASLIRFMTYREMTESQHSRKVVSFDAFGKFPAANRALDDEFIRSFEADGGVGIPKDELAKALERKHLHNFELVEGNIFDTIEPYLEKNTALKIALLHIDVDVYDATLFCLETLYDKVSRGGVIVFDDYGAVEGATKAIDDFMRKRQIASDINKLGFNPIPTYMVK